MNTRFRNRFRSALYCIVLAMVAGSSTAAEPAAAATLSNAQQVKQCGFDAANSWWTTSYDSVPGSIASNPVTGSPEFCEFYQFAQDWFLYLISPSSTAGLANWEDPSQYPLLETGDANSCDDAPAARALNIRTAKAVEDDVDAVLPERIDQAGAHAIYDQNGNVAFYEVRFSINLCDYESIQASPNFPGKTVELKMAWRVLEADESDSVKDTYYQTNASINGTDYLLGLVGWHIVVAADNHPEFVWITLDRDDNAVICDDIGAGQSAYSFTSQACASDASNCNNLNESLESTDVTLPATIQPNDICKEFQYGTLEGQGIDTRDGLNIALIEKLNAAMPAAFAQSGMPADLAVWQHYQFKGALWVSDITEPSGSSTGDTNQRGSLELANAVMETTFQGTSGQAGSAVNCLACHVFNGDQSSNTSYEAFLSHSFDDIIDGQCGDVQTQQVVNSQSEADATCPSTCAASAGTPAWNGQWTNQNAATGAQLPMTVCGCCPAPIVNN